MRDDLGDPSSLVKLIVRSKYNNSKAVLSVHLKFIAKNRVSSNLIALNNHVHITSRNKKIIFKNCQHTSNVFQITLEMKSINKE